MVRSIEKVSSFKAFGLKKNGTIEEALDHLEKLPVKLAVILDNQGSILATITDGDIRRALLAKKSLNSDALEIANKNPIFLPASVSDQTIINKMEENDIEAIPLISESGLYEALAHKTANFLNPLSESCMVIMAGGLGTRMGEKTKNCPKPMLLVNGTPILQHQIVMARDQGIIQFTLAINYLGSVIKNYFGDGSKFGVKITYIEEDKPLGTAGALSKYLPKNKLPIFVMNGDVLANFDFLELYKAHERASAKVTIAVTDYEVQIPYGCVQVVGQTVVEIKEKPIISNTINTGLYVVSIDALNRIPPVEKYDMPQLIQELATDNEKIIAHTCIGSWMDIGRPADLIKANS